MFIKMLEQANILKHTAAGSENAGQLVHGPGGLFNTPGIENPMLSTVIKPVGLGQFLPAFPTTYTDPRYSYITEITDDGDDEPDYICDPAPTATMGNGTLSTVFGRVQTATKVIELATASMTLNRADHMDLQFAGSLLDADGAQQPANVNEQGFLNNTIKNEMVKASFLMGLKNNKLLWQGNPSDASANGGYLPYNGLDLLIKTGYVDSVTDNAVLALDSQVVDAGWTELGVDDTIVQTLRWLMGFLENKANRTVGGATFAICMRSEMWEAISDIWAAVYVNELTAAIDPSSASRWSLDAASITAARDAMKTTNQLPIGGKIYPIVIDDGIKQLSNTDDSTNIPVGTYSSGIYVIPLTVGPGLPATFWEYLDWRVADSMLAQAGVREEVFWTDGARFLWTMDRKKTCISLQCRVEPRVVLRTPHLAARIDDLLVTPVMLMPDPHESNAGFVGGGETTRVAPVAKYGP